MAKEKGEDERWLMDEAWELNNKPWRFFNTMADYIEKNGDGSSQDKEAVEGLREWATWVGEGNNPRKSNEHEHEFAEKIVNNVGPYRRFKHIIIYCKGCGTVTVDKEI